MLTDVRAIGYGARLMAKMRGNGEAIGAIRERSGLSQSELARRVGVDRSALCRIESGARGGTPAQLRAIADALGVPLEAVVLWAVTADA